MTYSDSNCAYLAPVDVEGILQRIAKHWPSHYIKLRSPELLDSAIHRPMNAPSGFGLLDIAAMYFESIEGNQPLVDGNKRLAFYSVCYFLSKNGHDYINDDEDAAHAFLRALVENRPINKDLFKEWLNQYLVPKIADDA